MDQVFLADDQTVLFEVEGTPFEEDDDVFLEEDTDIDSATHTIKSARRTTKEIGVPFQAKSYVSIGTPIVSPLNKLLAKRGDPVPADIQIQPKHYEFYQIQLTCSFRAAHGCRFHDARFALALQTVPDVSNAPVQTIVDNAIAYDLSPQKVEDEYKVSNRHGINPQISLSGLSSPSISLPFYEGTAEYITHESHIEAFGLQGTQPAWSFMRTHAHEISGTYKLSLVIRKPKGTHVKATFSLTVNIQLMVQTVVLNPLVPLVMIFRRGRNSPVIIDTPTAPLC